MWAGLVHGLTNAKLQLLRHVLGQRGAGNWIEVILVPLTRKVVLEMITTDVSLSHQVCR